MRNNGSPFHICLPLISDDDDDGNDDNNDDDDVDSLKSFFFVLCSSKHLFHYFLHISILRIVVGNLNLRNLFLSASCYEITSLFANEHLGNKLSHVALVTKQSRNIFCVGLFNAAEDNTHRHAYLHK